MDLCHQIVDLETVSSPIEENVSSSTREGEQRQQNNMFSTSRQTKGMGVMALLVVFIIIVTAVFGMFASLMNPGMLTNGKEVVDHGIDDNSYPITHLEHDKYYGNNTSHTISVPSITVNSIVDDGTTANSLSHRSLPTTTGPPPPAAATTTTTTTKHYPTANRTSFMTARRHVVSEETKQQQLSFRRGDLAVAVPGLGIKICTGMQVKVIATAGQQITLADGSSSKHNFHSMPDGAAVLPTNNGYVYVSNSEMKSNQGGVYGLYFSNDGKVLDYQPLLSGSTRNCGGGRTPWNTWISCEEYGKGQCWQIDPSNRNPPQITKLGGTKGGNYESVAVDNRNKYQPIFFISEDAEFGALRRYTPPQSISKTIANWDTLHRAGGTTEYLLFLDNSRFTWTTNEQEGRNSQYQNYPNVEGIDFHNGYLYFVSKKLFQMFVLNLGNGTYTTMSTKFGGFQHSPDQIIRNGGEDKYIYLTEDGGNTVGVYSICRQTGERYTIFEAYNGRYRNDETTGLTFSPDGSRLYAAFQDCGCNNSESGIDPNCGCLLEFSRKDGMSFDGSTLSVKFHSSKMV